MDPLQMCCKELAECSRLHVEKDERIAALEVELAALRRRDRKLSCLEAAGVDNWEGYDWAMEEYN